MSKGYIDGTVRDRKYAEAILSRLLPQIDEASVVRVSSTQVRVDRTAIRPYNHRTDGQGEGSVPQTLAGS